MVATPGYVATQPGGAYTDIVGLALFLSSVAVVLHGRRAPRARLAATAIAALAAGLALGTKFTFLAPVGALTLAVLLDAALDRRELRTWLRAAVAWCVPLFLIGGYFYVRNAVQVGNPLPSTSLGPLHLPAPPISTQTFTVGQYLFDGAIWRDFYLPGLWQSLGPAWWAIFTVTIAAGALAVIIGRDPLQRLLGLVVLITIVAYLLTPQFLGFVDRPAYFVFNVRYVSPALALGLCLLPTLPPVARPRVVGWVFAAYVVVLGATQYGPTIWAWSATGLSRSPFLERIATSDVVLGIVVGLLVAVAGIAVAGRIGLGRRSSSIAVASIVAITLVALGYPLQESYLRRRYQSTAPLPTIYRWAQHHDHERIGLIGIDLQYPLYGQDGSNYVQYIGRHGKNGAFSPFTTCAAWRRAVNAGRFDYVVVVPRGFYLVPHPTEPPELTWTRAGGQSKIVRRDGPPGAAAVLLRLRGPLDPRTCPQR